MVGTEDSVEVHRAGWRRSRGTTLWNILMVAPFDAKRILSSCDLLQEGCRVRLSSQVHPVLKPRSWVAMGKSSNSTGPQPPHLFNGGADNKAGTH